MDQPPVLPDLTLLRRIGAGSYGDVWLARTLTGVYRAVKVVDRARFPDDRPFQRELEGISRFQRSVGGQPRQLALMHVGRLEPQGILYYVMELADDVAAGSDVDPESYEPLTLKALRARNPVLPAADCVVLGVELARGLVGLHAAGLIHRDVKPSNIIVVGGMPKLADIGLVSSREASVTSLGTPGYSPPEGSGSQSADLFGLGRMLYELVTGLGTAEFPRLPPDFDKRADASALLELNEVVLRACEPDPKDRYPSAQAMLDDLLLIQAGKSVKELNETRRRLKVFGRFALLAGAVAALVIAVLGVRNYFAVRALAVQETAARQQAETDERMARYTADLNIAQMTLDRGEVGLARSALRRQIPAIAGDLDLRGLEWRALWNESEGDEARIFGEVGPRPINGTALSPNGRWLVTEEGTTSRTTVVWDRTDGTRRVLATGTFRLGGFTEDASHVISGRPDGGIQLIDVISGEVTPIPEIGAGKLQGAAEDGRSILVTQDTPTSFRLSVWDVVTRSQLGFWQSEPGPPSTRPNVEALSRDHRLLAVSAFRPVGTELNRELFVWDLLENRYLFRRTDLARPRALAFSPDGTLLAMAGPGIPIHLLGAQDGRTVRRLAGHPGRVLGVAFSPNGRWLASVGEDQLIRVWDTMTGVMIGSLRGHEAVITSVAWDPAGERIVSTSEDGTVREWQFPAAERVFIREGFWNADLLGDVLFSPDSSQLVASLANGRLSLVDRSTLLPSGEGWEGAFHPLGFGSDGVRALNKERELVIVDPANGTVRATGLRLSNDAAPLITVAASRDGRIAALGLQDGRLEFWDCVAAQSLPVVSQEHARSVWALALSDNGRIGASGDRNGKVVVWRPLESRSVGVLSGSELPVYGLALSADGTRLVIAREGGSMTVVDTDSLTVVAERFAHTRGFQSALFSADGHRLVTGGSDGLLIVWSFPDLRQVGVLSLEPTVDTKGNSAVYRMQLSPDGTELIAFTEDGRLRRWVLR